jgi:hypothetical protein
LDLGTLNFDFQKILNRDLTSPTHLLIGPMPTSPSILLNVKAMPDYGEEVFDKTPWQGSLPVFAAVRLLAVEAVLAMVYH